jgi:putative addiction module killer protein
MINVQAYTREDGSIPFQKWLESLNLAAAQRVIIAQRRLELGNTSNVKWFDGIGEYRINWGPGYRIYFAQEGEDLILLYAGGTKKRQQADIALALTLHKEYQGRKNQTSQEGRLAIDQPSPPNDLANRKKKQ